MFILGNLNKVNNNKLQTPGTNCAVGGWDCGMEQTAQYDYEV